MKKSIVIASFLFIAASYTFASSMRLTAIGEFNFSTEVQQLVAQAQAAGLEVDEIPTAVILTGTCGFAGCQTTSLVTVATRTQGANTQTEVIAAIVTVNSGGPGKVIVIDASKVLELAP